MFHWSYPEKLTSSKAARRGQVERVVVAVAGGGRGGGPGGRLDATAPRAPGHKGARVDVPRLLLTSIHAWRRAGGEVGVAHSVVRHHPRRQAARSHRAVATAATAVVAGVRRTAVGISTSIFEIQHEKSLSVAFLSQFLTNLAAWV